VKGFIRLTALFSPADVAEMVAGNSREVLERHEELHRCPALLQAERG
jgi:hypothetical protein